MPKDGWNVTKLVIGLVLVLLLAAGGIVAGVKGLRDSAPNQPTVAAQPPPDPDKEFAKFEQKMQARMAADPKLAARLALVHAMGPELTAKGIEVDAKAEGKDFDELSFIGPDAKREWGYEVLANAELRKRLKALGFKTVTWSESMLSAEHRLPI